MCRDCEEIAAVADIDAIFEVFAEIILIEPDTDFASHGRIDILITGAEAKARAEQKH
jgi:hypothetical protein